MATEKSQTVWAATYDLLRSLELTTVFGNPGSTEQPFLKNFPPTFNTSLACRRHRLSRWRADLPKQHGALHW